MWFYTLGSFLLSFGLDLSGGESQAIGDFRKIVRPILIEYCYDCHGDGMNKGGVAFDELEGKGGLLDPKLWFKVIKNVRADLMPPEEKPQPSSGEVSELVNWVKYGVFGLDPRHPDPGRVTLRRLNRTEYSNTIRDLMGVEFHASEEFPPDDTGYGFDNIGDVLTMSPILMEKYVMAAESIVADAVPVLSKVVKKIEINGREFRKPDEPQSDSLDQRPAGDRSSRARDVLAISYYTPTIVSHRVTLDRKGDYSIVLNLKVRGAFDFDPGRCRLIFSVNGREAWSEQFKWQDRKPFQIELKQELPRGEHELTFELQPLTPAEKRKTSVDMQIGSVEVRGPLDPQFWVSPPNYERFFSREKPPEGERDREEYAREVLRDFASKAFRRPVDAATVDRLVAFAVNTDTRPGETFEQGIARAMVAVLASPRFLFRIEDVQGDEADREHRLLDEYALASRLSYFLWSTMPDDELIDLARRGELRDNLTKQAGRMVANERSGEFVRNFVGQWLQVRDIDGIQIDSRAVLSRDQGRDRERERQRERFRELRAIPDDKITEAEKKELAEILAGFRKRFRAPTVELNRELRRAMRQETEMMFDQVMRADRSVIDLIDSDYTFLNNRLAKHYGISDVTGEEMRKVSLPADSMRGSVLTHGSVLVVTSNPTRTSPVKRGLFILDNILGTPPPPPPAAVPALEESEKEFTDHEPTLKDILELHRSKPLCASCHARMDPLGLALENFNALAMWRDKERGQRIDTPGKLITGESFADVRELKRILANDRRSDFYRCLTEKLLTYALGRGLEYYDVETVDQIVARLGNSGGRFSALLMGVVESAPFQKRRGASGLSAGEQAKQGRKIAKN